MDSSKSRTFRFCDVGEIIQFPLNNQKKGVSTMPNHAESVQNNSSTLCVITVVGSLLMPVIFPLVMWLALRTQNKTVEDTAKETLNFQLTFIAASIVIMIGLFILSALGALLGSFIGAFFGVVLWGFTYAALGISYLVLMVKATIAASKNEVYRFPFTVRLIG
jgi:uncharacterized protein